jgi:hypothetical protein
MTLVGSTGPRARNGALKPMTEAVGSQFAARPGFYNLAREAVFFGAQDGRALINFRVLYQLIKA